MNALVKSAFALAAGLAALAVVQNAWLFLVKQRINSESAMRAGMPEMKPLAFEMQPGTAALFKPPQIDTRAAQDAAISSLASGIDRQIRNANSYVPVYVPTRVR